MQHTTVIGSTAQAIVVYLCSVGELTAVGYKKRSLQVELDLLDCELSEGM